MIWLVAVIVGLIEGIGWLREHMLRTGAESEVAVLQNRNANLSHRLEGELADHVEDVARREAVITHQKLELGLLQEDLNACSTVPAVVHERLNRLLARLASPTGSPGPAPMPGGSPTSALASTNAGPR